MKTSSNPIDWYAGNNARYRVHKAARNDLNISDRMASGFANSGTRWLIETVTDSESALWDGVMAVTHPDAATRKIWSTSYYRIQKSNQPTNTATADLNTIKDDLRHALNRIARFAERRSSGFLESFSKALEELESSTPSPFGWKGKIIPTALEMRLEAKQLLSAGQAAYVFGGMGSWNDQYWPDPEINAEYDAVSGELFAAVEDGLTAAANSTCAFA